jgi:molybdenum cofactor synthesis domain-containing protein
MEKKRGLVKSINRSTEKGTAKYAVDSALITKLGVEDDAHAGSWHRQVSLLAWEKIQEFAQTHQRPIMPGEFGENITVQGVPMNQLQVLDRLKLGSVELEVTQIGKACHGEACAIYQEMGECIMPHYGIFARVLNEGTLQAKDNVYIEHRPFSAHLIVLSDRVAQGVYEDRSGALIKEMLMDFCRAHFPNFSIKKTVLPDESQALTREFYRAKQAKTDLIFTTGGTGWGKRDITTTTLRPLLSREMSGVMDWVKIKYGSENPAVFLSDALAGIAGESLLFSLPGSLKAAKEYMQELVPLLKHIILNYHGIGQH